VRRLTGVERRPFVDSAAGRRSRRSTWPPWGRYRAYGGVLAAAYLVSLLVYHRANRFPVLGGNDLTGLSGASSASWHDLLLGKVGVHAPGEKLGRQFRPLAFVTYRLDDLVVDPLGPGHNYLNDAVLAVLALACFVVVRRICGRLSLLETAVAGALCASVPISFAGSDAGVEIVNRVDVLLAISVVVAAAALIALMEDGPRLDDRRRWRLLATLAAAAFAAGLSKEDGPFIVLGLVVLWAAVRVFADGAWREAAEGLGATLASLVVFYVYKAAAGGTGQLLLTNERTRLHPVDTSWGIPGIGHVLRPLGPIGPNLGYVLSDGVRMIVATIVPMFTDYGHVVARRLPFMVFFLGLAWLVFRSLRARETRRVSLLLLGGIVVAAGTGIYSLRPRLLIPGYALWIVVASVGLIVCLRRRWGRARWIAVAVAGAVIVGAAISYQQELKSEIDRYGDLYGPPSDNAAYRQLVAGQRTRYGCSRLPSYRSFVGTESFGDRVAHAISGLRIVRPEPSAAQLARLEARCGLTSGPAR